jgi:alpha-ribazole phosphatase
MRMILVRHYKTIGDAANEIIGWTDSPPADGWQADMAFVIWRLNKANVTFDSACTSRLERARKTGEFYAHTLSIQHQWSCGALNEINYGKMSKKNKQWVEQHVPWHKTDHARVYPGGESFLHMQRRSVSYIEWLGRKHRRANILVVAHAGVIRALVCHFLQLNYAANLKRKLGHRYIGDFTIENGRCLQYPERGIPSGFLSGQIINNPWRPPLPQDTVRATTGDCAGADRSSARGP